MAEDDIAPGAEASETPPNDTGTYTVGYGRPPEHGKIKPGEIRNRRGKLPGTRSLKKDVAEILKMPVPMVQDGKTRRVTTRFASLMKLREKALKGDARSLDRLLEYAAQHDEEEGVRATTGTLLEEDAEILANALERRRQTDLANARPASLPTPENRQEDEQ